MRHLVATRHGQMHVRVSPGSGKPLLALHMSPLSGAMWVRLMDRLSRPVIAPDRIGFGFATLDGQFGELGYISLDEIESVKLPLGLKIERDLYFTPKTLKEAKAQINVL